MQFQSPGASMKTRSILMATLCVLGTSFAAAQTPKQATAESASKQGAPMSQGEVRKVDKSAKKITLKHGELKNLGMPPMTMVFGVKDDAMLDKVKAGDKVQFVAEDLKGALTITAIEAAK
jgi:Cu(I)/Ag(I) efflux system periplasmic protein CusF